MWGHTTREKKIHLINWDKITKPNNLGWLGLRKSSDVNATHMAKLKWELATSQKPWTTLFKIKYSDPNKLYRTSSLTYKSIFKDKNIFYQNISYLVRNGDGINLWSQPWVNKLLLRAQITGPLPQNENLKRVSNIIVESRDEYHWNLYIIPFSLPNNISDQIKSIALPFPFLCKKYGIVWNSSSNSVFTLSSAYEALLKQPNQNETIQNQTK